MSTMSTFPGIVLLFLALANVASALAPTPAPARPGNGLVDKVCKTTRYPDLCTTTLSAHPTAASANVHGLANLALEAASTHAKNISAILARKVTATEDPYLLQCYSDCSENFLDANEQLEDSRAALESDRYNDVNTWVSAAMSDAESCQGGFNDQGAKDAKLVARSQNFIKFCSNVLAITNLIAG